MRKSELIKLLLSSNEEEVFIMIDGFAHEIDTEIEHIPEAFDGFFTAYPKALGLKVKEDLL